MVGRELEKAEQPMQVVIIGAERAPELIDALRQQGCASCRRWPIQNSRCASSGSIWRCAYRPGLRRRVAKPAGRRRLN